MDFGRVIPHIRSIQQLTVYPWNPGCSQTKLTKEAKGIVTCAARLHDHFTRCPNRAKYKFDNVPLCGVHLKTEMRLTTTTKCNESMKGSTE